MVEPLLPVVEQYRHWIASSPLESIVGLWIGLRTLELILRRRLSRFAPDWGRRRTSWSVSRLYSRTVGTVDDYIASLDPALDADSQFTVAVRERPTPAVVGQATVYALSVEVLHEGVVRGIPFGAAVALGMDPLIPVAASSLFWAFSHVRVPCIGYCTTTMWLQVALWATGRWPLALGLLAVEMLVSIGLLLGKTASHRPLAVHGE